MDCVSVFVGWEKVRKDSKSNYSPVHYLLEYRNNLCKDLSCLENHSQQAVNL